jgi:two-component system, LuxR family, response regulator FixJ
VSPPAPVVAIVDDEAPIRRALERLMRSAGLDAQTFACGADFLASLPIAGLRCVVLDVHMPGLDGLEVQSHLTKSWPQLPIIFVTGREDPQAQQRAMAARPLAFLKKPIDDHLLLDAIASAP